MFWFASFLFQSNIFLKDYPENLLNLLSNQAKTKLKCWIKIILRLDNKTFWIVFEKQFSRLKIN